MKKVKGIEIREYNDFSTKTPSHINRKWIDWDLEKINFVRSLYLNGFSDKDIADQIGCSLQTYKLRVNQQPDIRDIFDSAKESAIADATEALEKIAKGYYDEEITYGSEIKESRELEALIGEMKELIPPKHRETADLMVEKANTLLSEGSIVKRVRKWYPPNKDAINKILDAHRGEVWDAEARRKTIPQVKLNVTLGDKALRARKQIKPDYEVVS